MTHKEFTLTVKKEIMENAGYAREAVKYRIGDTMQVNEAIWEQLKAGKRVDRPTQEGYIQFDKYNFENEVQVTTITVEYSTRRLGQRNLAK
jgi:hypothetical protein